MFDILKYSETAVELIKEIKSSKNRNDLMYHAIIAEAKFNNDLADIICRSNANELATSNPKVYQQFSTDTSEILTTIGIPAYKILKDNNAPLDQTIEELGKSSTPNSLFEKKTASELYEFYIRKCRLLKSLSFGDSLALSKISLQARCKNIRTATRYLIIKCQEKE